MSFVGIDFGTTNSVVSCLEKDENGISKLKVLEIDNGMIMPTAIFFDKGKWIIGKKALDKYNRHPYCGAILFKRHIGTTKKFLINKFTDEIKKSSRKDKKYFVIDTNIFINNLEFEEKLAFNEFIILPDIVGDKEVPFRTLDGNTDIQSKNAIKLIKQLLEEEKLYKMKSDISYIPQELMDRERSRNDENDNKIFSVAYKLKQKGFDVTLLTGDKGLRDKARAYDIKEISPKNFLEERKDQKRADVKILSPEECTMIFLSELKAKIEKILKKNIENAVITVPANFDEVQRGLIKNQAKRAGFNKVILEDEPVAAVMVYAEESKENEIIGVYDFGGGTFDFSIIETNVEENTITVRAIDGDKTIGGENFTEGIVNEIMEDKIVNELKGSNIEYLKELRYLKDLQLSKQNKEANENMLRRKAEEIKKLLSVSDKETCSLEGFYVSDSEKQNLSFEITRDEFSDVVANGIIDVAEDCINKAINAAGLNIENINRIVLAGGTSSIKQIQNRINDIFGEKPLATKDLATIVSQGAALLGSGKGRKRIKQYLNRFIGVELKGGQFYSMLDYETRIPCKNIGLFSPIEDNQGHVKIKIYSKHKDSTAVMIEDEGIEYIGMATIGGLKEFSKDELDIEVTFEVDDDKILKVLAKVEDEKGSFSKEAEICIEAKIWEE